MARRAASVVGVGPPRQRRRRWASALLREEPAREADFPEKVALLREPADAERGEVFRRDVSSSVGKSGKRTTECGRKGWRCELQHVNERT